ncbi:unnamed protein product [Kuraishia capsulata CBS 1993]|uniref:OTU domain-containing protein n=1 Tax=Kuraishia capsulata CBS 1993 TaxID=1382522 RepID=W6MW35_9ASCO|nr:uncharacterized protein KUCA_T00002824001 [Kuraishia capsulata CBS 1993]CDK26850.1 unnamed protein product [Kuraishia capsulata CBS 1993]
MSSDNLETKDQLLARHKKENRDLIATVTGLKKQATKSKKKEVMKKCQQLEDDLKARHAREISVFENGEEEQEEVTPEQLLAELELDSKPESNNETSAITNSNSSGPQKKRNRQKERLAKRDAAMAEIRNKAIEEAEGETDYRAIELDNIELLCKKNKLSQFDIQPDGHCLFASIADQLKTRQGIDTSVKELRSKAAQHIRNDPDTYAPFLFDEATMTIKDVKSYTDEIENTALWGGDMEIMALAKEYNCPISVMMSGRATHRVNEEGPNAELKLVYYKHSFGLGEHYNSLRDEA